MASAASLASHVLYLWISSHHWYSSSGLNSLQIFPGRNHRISEFTESSMVTLTQFSNLSAHFREDEDPVPRKQWSQSVGELHSLLGWSHFWEFLFMQPKFTSLEPSHFGSALPFGREELTCHLFHGLTLHLIEGSHCAQLSPAPA